MQKKKTNKKKLSYIPENSSGVYRLERWNYCQYLAKKIYRSEISNIDLATTISDIENYNLKIKIETRK